MAQQVLWAEPVELAMSSKSLQNYPHNQILQTSLSLNIIIFDTYFSQGYKLLTIYFERLETYESWGLQGTNLEIENILQYHKCAKYTNIFSRHNSSVSLHIKILLLKFTYKSCGKIIHVRSSNFYIFDKLSAVIMIA